MKVTSAHEARAVTVISHDVEATLGAGQEDAVRHEAAMRRAFFNDCGSIDVNTVDEYVEDVAEKIQQYFHDCFVDSTWPECPLHRRHPLWLHQGSWLCEQSRARVAKLGELRARRDPAGRYLVLTDEDRAPAV